MGRYDFRPARVHQTASQILSSTDGITARPPWYDVVASNPPSQILVRSLPVQHTGHRKGPRKPSKLFKPQNITYPEDSFRKTFFADHPWELARPRVVLEDSGADHRQQQWESVRQRGGHLSGENVVQRQAWLMEQKRMSKDDAYDQARREFYHERLREDIERRVAKEEAIAYGAHFGRTRIGIGNDLEDKEFENFREWAKKTVAETESARAAAYSGLDAPASSTEGSQGPQLTSALGSTDAPLQVEKEGGASESSQQGIGS